MGNARATNRFCCHCPSQAFSYAVLRRAYDNTILASSCMWSYRSITHDSQTKMTVTELSQNEVVLCCCLHGLETYVMHSNVKCYNIKYLSKAIQCLEFRRTSVNRKNQRSCFSCSFSRRHSRRHSSRGELRTRKHQFYQLKR